MIIDDIMTRTEVTVEMDDRLTTVKSLFDNAPIHHLPVVDDGLLVGVVSDRDLFRAISPNIGTSRYSAQDLATLERCVHAIMSRRPLTRKTDSHVWPTPLLAQPWGITNGKNGRKKARFYDLAQWYARDF